MEFLIWHWFCSTEMKGSKYHSGVIYPICPEGLHWPGKKQAGVSIWCQEETAWAGTLPASQGIPLQCSEQTQKTKSQSWPGSQNENRALWDLPLKARSQGSARS